MSMQKVVRVMRRDERACVCVSLTLGMRSEALETYVRGKHDVR